MSFQNIFNVILNAGIKNDTPPYLATNLRAAAIVNLILLGLLSVFMAIFIMLAPAINLVLTAALSVLVISITMQFFGLHILSRMLTSCIICALATIVHNIIAEQVGQIVPLTFAMCALLSLAPWFLFSISEILYASCAFSINITCLIVGYYKFSLFKLSDDITGLNHPALQMAILIAGLVLMSASTIALQALNRKEAIKAQDLLQRVQQDNVASLEKQEQLNSVLSQLKEVQIEDQKRSWVSKGLAEASKILRDSDIDMVSDKLISFLVKYLECNQGALFILDQSEDEVFFTLKGCYAYDRKKYLDKKIAVGEGLLGECYYDKSYIHLTQVPKNYTHITSGLGEATPRSILIVPLLAHEVMYGALEFASFNSFEKHHIDFLEEIGETTAQALRAIKGSIQTQELLRETQMMTEQMKAQEEEMRQNMEELAATQEQQMRIEEELRAQLQSAEQELALLKKKLNLTPASHF